MKHIILTTVSAAALAVAGQANAQSNDSLVNQTGSGAEATVTQSGQDNSSEVQQSAGATATVTQAGSNTLPGGYTPDSYPNNRSYVEQNVDGADATVDQDGTLNRSSVVQNDAATADVEQDGTYNHSDVTQSAGSNGATAMVTQGATTATTVRRSLSRAARPPL